MDAAPSPAVAAAFDAFAEPVRAHLMALRREIMAHGAAESLKWGQPSYVVEGGTPVRLGAARSGGYGLFVHCSTRLIEEHRMLAPHLRYDGSRGVVMEEGEAPDMEALRPLVAAAMRYHRR